MTRIQVRRTTRTTATSTSATGLDLRTPGGRTLPF
jgi:hypothetical protein